MSTNTLEVEVLPPAKYATVAHLKTGDDAAVAKQLNKLFAEAQAITDPAARLAKFDELQAYILSQAPYASVYAPKQTTMCSTTTGGFYLHPVYQLDPADYWKK